MTPTCPKCRDLKPGMLRLYVSMAKHLIAKFGRPVSAGRRRSLRRRHAVEGGRMITKWMAQIDGGPAREVPYERVWSYLTATPMAQRRKLRNGGWAVGAWVFWPKGGV
jgi:hypothetical protein